MKIAEFFQKSKKDSNFYWHGSNKEGKPNVSELVGIYFLDVSFKITKLVENNSNKQKTISSDLISASVDGNFNTNCPAAIKNKILKKEKKNEDFYNLEYLSCKFFDSPPRVA